MDRKILDAVFEAYQRDVLGPRGPENLPMDRFHEFLARHGGLRILEVPGRRPQLLASSGALRCFHFSQYLEWYLPEKVAAPGAEIDAARAALARFNAWLVEVGAITQEDFIENQEAILGREPAGGAMEAVAPEEESESGESGPGDVPEERDFYVPGEYSATLSGELILTKVQEGILYGTLADGGKEIGPILVERGMSSGHKIGDRVHLSLGRAGDHWNLLSTGQRRD